MGKATCDVGATEAARKLSAKLGLRLNESTMRGINQDYVTEQNRKRKRGEDDLTIISLPMKKQGRPLLLGKTLDVTIQAMEASRLAKNGGPATLSVPWAKFLLKRMDFRKWRGVE